MAKRPASYRSAVREKYAFMRLRPLKNHDTLAMVVVFGTKTNLAVKYTLFFRETV
jgi:hypothetical protein